MTDAFKALRPLEIKGRKAGSYYSLAALEVAGLGRVSRLPVSIRVMLESLLRNVDGERVTEQHVRELAAWQPNAERTKEVPFVVARLIAPDASGIPLLADLAWMPARSSRW
jgi:aconitate hydratase